MCRTGFSIQLLLLPFFLIFNLNTANTQNDPEWRFHVAFEDATGAQDTIWLVWNDAASLGIDTAFNEGPVEMHPDSFNVFLLNQQLDSTKTLALEFGWMGIDANVFAMNYELPLEISWDTTMFDAPVLQNYDCPVTWARMYNVYFFFENNMEDGSMFDMLHASQTQLPPSVWDDSELFPMYVGVQRTQGDGSTSGNQEIMTKKKMSVYPNPARGSVNVESNVRLENIAVYTSEGVRVKAKATRTAGNNYRLDVSSLLPGLYMLNCQMEQGREERAKLVVARK